MIELRSATDGTVPRWGTTVRVGWNRLGLFVRFECRDDHAWSTYTERDEPLWKEEVVEVFLAPGREEPPEYAEVEVSPRGVLFDAWISNPDGLRETMKTDVTWNWPGIAWRAGRLPEHEDWWAELDLPWAGLGLDKAPTFLRANFLRVERPKDGVDEYSAWSPTFADPPNFHIPERFGLLRIDGHL